MLLVSMGVGNSLSRHIVSTASLTHTLSRPAFHSSTSHLRFTLKFTFGLRTENALRSVTHRLCAHDDSCRCGDFNYVGAWSRQAGLANRASAWTQLACVSGHRDTCRGEYAPTDSQTRRGALFR